MFLFFEMGMKMMTAELIGKRVRVSAPIAWSAEGKVVRVYAPGEVPPADDILSYWSCALLDIHRYMKASSVPRIVIKEDDGSYTICSSSSAIKLTIL